MSSKVRSQIAASVDVIPAMYARLLLTPPPSELDQDKPLFVYHCPHCARLKLLTEPLTIWPAVVQCHSRPVVLLQGTAIFIGDHLWKGYPDALPDRLLAVLQRAYDLDSERGRLGQWTAGSPVYSSWTPPKPLPSIGDLFKAPNPGMGKAAELRKRLAAAQLVAKTPVAKVPMPDTPVA